MPDLPTDKRKRQLEAAYYTDAEVRRTSRAMIWYLVSQLLGLIVTAVVGYYYWRQHHK